jgi:hypothetical protein
MFQDGGSVDSIIIISGGDRSNFYEWLMKKVYLAPSIDPCLIEAPNYKTT